MTRFEYIEALRQALSDLPPDIIAATVAEYENRIAAASATGRSEEEILAGLDSPQQVAAERRAAKRFQAFKQNKTPINFVRMFFSFIGLMMFNLFLIVPAIVYSALLVASFAVALACYSGGIMMTATGLAGVSEISFGQAFHRSAHNEVEVHNNRDNHDNSHVVIDIGKDTKPAAGAASAGTTVPSASAPAAGARIADTAMTDTTCKACDTVIVSDGNDHLDFTGDDDGMNIDMPGMHIHSPGDSHHLFFGTDEFGESRPVLVSVGIGLILGGILMFLLCLVVGKFTVIGIVRLVQMEFSVLKNA